MKNIIVITGGAGFVGSNLIEYFVKNTNYKIISFVQFNTTHETKSHIVSFVLIDLLDVYDLFQRHYFS